MGKQDACSGEVKRAEGIDLGSNITSQIENL